MPLPSKGIVGYFHAQEENLVDLARQSFSAGQGYVRVSRMTVGTLFSTKQCGNFLQLVRNLL